MKNFKYYLLFILFLSINVLESQIKLSDLNTLSVNDIAKMFVGSNEVVKNITFKGSNNSCGIFKSAINTGIGIDSGIILTSGSVSNVKGPNKSKSTSSKNNSSGDDGLSQLVNCETKDAAILEFDFLPRTETVSFLYVFASEEYNEYVDSTYNDVFAFFIDGVNIALLPNSYTPVAINNLNAKRNSNYYNNNETYKYNIECDGFTKVLEAKTIVRANEWHHIKIAIADVSDDLYDSWIFIQANSFRTIPKYKLTTIVIPEGSGKISGNTGTQAYDEGSIVSLKANPTSCFTFKNWQGDFSSTEPQISIKMDADKIVYANFERGIYDCMKKVYDNDFQSSVTSGWSKNKISITPNGNRRFLGEFSNETVNLSISNLLSHQLVKVDFDLYIIRSWDGNDKYSHADSAVVGPDIWEFSADGNTFKYSTTFSNWPQSKQAYPNEYPDNSFNFRTLATENNSLGYTIDFYDKRPMDAVYHLELIFKHTQGSILLSFLAKGLQDIGDESWGIDNVKVNTICECIPPIILSKNILNFNAKQNGALPASQSLNISNIGGGVLNWKVSKVMNWLDITPSEGTNAGEIIASINTTNLPVGVYYDTISIIDPGASNNPQKRIIVYSVESGAKIKVQLPDTTIENSSIEIPLKIDDLTGKNVTFFKFSLSYKNDFIQPELPVITKGTLCDQKDWIVYLENDLKGNSIIIGYGITPLIGAGNLLKIKFNVMNKNSFSIPLTINYFNFNDGDPEAVIQNGKISVNNTNNIIEKDNNFVRNLLEQNHPNPFNPATKIQYQIKNQGFVKISIYNILGELITVLVDEWKAPGRYEVIFDAKLLSSGIYFYYLKSKEFQEIKRMILTK